MSDFAFIPTEEQIQNSNIQSFMNKHGISSLLELSEKAKTNLDWFWKEVDEVFSEEKNAVEEAKTNPQTINFLVGKVMQKTKGKADPTLTLNIIKKKLS